MEKDIVIKRILIIIFVIVLVCGISVYMFTNLNCNKKTNITLHSTKPNIIKLKDKFPMSDNMGKKITYDEENSSVQGYFEFEVENKTDVDSEYEIFVSDSKFNNTIHPNYIKLYLTDENNVPVKGFENNIPTYYYLRVSSVLPTGRKLYNGYLAAHQSKKFILRVWVGDAYKIDQNSKDFGINIYVEAY